MRSKSTSPRYFGKPVDMRGITRRVVQELLPKAGIKHRYLLECGHVAQRNVRGKQFCYCAECLKGFM